MEETGRGDSFTKGEAACGEDDDSPEEIVEVFFGQDASAKESDHRDDSDDAHVAEDVFELVGDAPEDYCDEGDNADEVLDTCEFIFHRPDGDDGGAFAGLECDEEEGPD